jgi:hypothetical protein
MNFARCAALITLLASLVSVTAAPPPEVGLRLVVPPQQTYVIGDPIELRWQFENNTTNALAFMWEGCCRVNGRVDMKREGLAPVPSGSIRPNHVGRGPGIYNSGCLHCRLERQKSELTVTAAPQGPATAHMFARPARLDAAGSQEFNSALANWVLLEEPGDYLLTGNYLGVHPKQRPQLLRRGRLWTGITKSPVIRLSLLSPADYLSEREARSRLRGVGIALSAPAKIEPFASGKLAIRLTNHTPSDISLHWPGDAELWITDGKGKRVPSSRYAITDFGHSITLPGNSGQTLDLPVNHEWFTGQPFGDYGLFVELKESTNHIRVPSNRAQLRWDLDTRAVARLLTQAGDQPAIGHRNPPLKLLRIHLTDLAPVIPLVDTSSFSAKARQLTADLRVASVLKRLQPQPGTATLNLGINHDRPAAFQAPALLRAFPEMPDPFQQLARVIALRRHLGWNVEVNLRINRQASMQSIGEAVVQLQGQGIKPTTKVFNSTATAFSKITFPPTPVDAVEISTANLKATSGYPTLAVPPTMSWSEVLGRVAPLVEAGRGFEIVRREQ